MDYKFVIDLILIVCIIFIIYKKIFGWSNFNQYKKNALKKYKIVTLKSKIIQYICLGCSILFLILYIFNISIGRMTLNSTMIMLIMVLFYFGFLPNSTGYWILTENGIFIYMYDKMIKWKEMINVGFIEIKKSPELSFMTAMTKKSKGEGPFKQTQFRCIIPTKDKEEVEKYIKANIDKVLKEEMKKRAQNSPRYY